VRVLPKVRVDATVIVMVLMTTVLVLVSVFMFMSMLAAAVTRLMRVSVLVFMRVIVLIAVIVLVLVPTSGKNVHELVEIQKLLGLVGLDGIVDGCLVMLDLHDEVGIGHLRNLLHRELEAVRVDARLHRVDD